MSDFFNLDQNEIQEEIKDYIKNNSTLLQDYNFDAAATSQLTGLLSYVTQYVGFYLNMVANELFLSTAQIRKNVYKIATMLNYVPTRANAPYVEATFTNTSTLTSVAVPRYTEFTFGNANLVTLEDMTITAGATATLNLYEGDIVFATITVPDTNDDGYYITPISNQYKSESLKQYLQFTLDDYEFIDDDYLYVFDTYDVGGSEDEWLMVNKENPEFGGKYYYLNYLDDLTLMFDNGSFFQKPNTGSGLYAHYLKTSGTLYNNTSGSIVMTSTFTNYSSITVTTGTNLLANGSDPETIDSIKTNAPLFYTTNNRAVTESDWAAVVKKYPAYSTLEDVRLWGGNREYVNNSYQITDDESNIKDVGYVYVSGVKSNTSSYDNARYDFTYMDIDEKVELENFMSKFKILTLFFKWLDPNIIYFRPTISAKLATGFVDSTTVSYQINEYLYNNYVGFDKELNKSNLTQFVDNMEEVSYSDLDYTTFMRVLNNSSNYLPTSSTYSETRVNYEDWKVLRFGACVSQNSIDSLIFELETLSTSSTIYNDSVIYSGTHAADILDNNVVSNVVVGDDLWYVSASLGSGSTFSATDTISITAPDTSEALALGTISNVYRFYDVPSLATLGAIMLDSVTLGAINYETGFCTISTTGSTISGMISYAFNFEYVDEVHTQVGNESMLSPKPINLTVL